MKYNRNSLSLEMLMSPLLPSAGRWAIKQLAVSNKKVAKEALERDELVRATWLAAYGDLQLESCLWLDDSSVDDCTSQCHNGWAPLGHACVYRQTFILGRQFSVLPDLSVDGIVALDIFEGSVMKEQFIDFLKNQIVRQGIIQMF